MHVTRFILDCGYRLVSKLGKGSFSTVFKALRLKDGVEVAVKVIPLFKLKKKHLRSCLEEVRIMRRVGHPNLVDYIDAFLDSANKILFVITEYLGGGDLSMDIARRRRDQRPFTEPELWRFAIQILKGLRALHKERVVHRDIKPANLFLTSDLRTVKIGDLNTGRILIEKEMLSSVIGTPNYLAPEIWFRRPTDFRCDIFSLGCVLFEMASLSPIFSEKSIGQLMNRIQNGQYPEVPSRYSRQFRALVSCCLIRDVRQSFSAHQLLTSKVLRDKLGGFPTLRTRRASRGQLDWSLVKTPSSLTEFASSFCRWKTKKSSDPSERSDVQVSESVPLAEKKGLYRKKSDIRKKPQKSKKNPFLKKSNWKSLRSTSNRNYIVEHISKKYQNSIKQSINPFESSAKDLALMNNNSIDSRNNILNSKWSFLSKINSTNVLSEKEKMGSQLKSKRRVKVSESPWKGAEPPESQTRTPGPMRLIWHKKSRSEQATNSIRCNPLNSKRSNRIVDPSEDQPSNEPTRTGGTLDDMNRIEPVRLIQGPVRSDLRNSKSSTSLDKVVGGFGQSDMQKSRSQNNINRKSHNGKIKGKIS